MAPLAGLLTCIVLLILAGWPCDTWGRGPRVPRSAIEADQGDDLASTGLMRHCLRTVNVRATCARTPTLADRERRGHLLRRRLSQSVATWEPLPATPDADAYFVRSNVGMACRVKINTTGSCRNCMITFQASTISLASPGRNTISPGMARSDGSCSIG